MLRILGTAQLTEPYGLLGQSVLQNAYEVPDFLKAAEALGFNAVDTSPTYGEAEEEIGRASFGMAVHTKLREGVDCERSILGSLGRIRRRISIAYLHDPNAVLRDGGKQVLDAAHLTGTYFDRLGTSVYSVDALMASLDRPEIGAIQVPINPLWRDHLKSLPPRFPGRPLILARSVLAQGLIVHGSANLTMKARHLLPFIQNFEAVCKTIGRSTIETAIVWSRDLEGLDGHIIGATSIGQLQDIALAFQAPELSLEERAMIDSIPLPSTAIFDPRTWK